VGIKIKCEDSADLETFSGNMGKALDLICPENCGKIENYQLFGTGVYSDDSMICLAALHLGTLSNTGGHVKITIEGEQAAFKAST